MAVASAPVFDALVTHLAADVVAYDPFALYQATAGERRARSLEPAAFAVALTRAALAPASSDMAFAALGLIEYVHDPILRGKVARYVSHSLLASSLGYDAPVWDQILAMARALPNHCDCLDAKVAILLALHQSHLGRQPLFEEAMAAATQGATSASLVHWLTRCAPPPSGTRVIRAVMEHLAGQTVRVLAIHDLDHAMVTRMAVMAAADADEAADLESRQQVAAFDAVAAMHRAAELFEQRVVARLQHERQQLVRVVAARAAGAVVDDAELQHDCAQLEAIVAAPKSTTGASIPGRYGAEARWRQLTVLHVEELDAVRDVLQSAWMSATPLHDFYHREMVGTWAKDVRDATDQLVTCLRALAAPFAGAPCPCDDRRDSGDCAERAGHDDPALLIADTDIDIDALLAEAQIVGSAVAAPTQQAAITVADVATGLQARLRGAWRACLSAGDCRDLASYCARPENVIEAARFYVRMGGSANGPSPPPRPDDATSELSAELERDVEATLRADPPPDGLARLFWTGGFDSTFRLCQLVLDDERVVQPIYLDDAAIDNFAGETFRRHSWTQERAAMDAIVQAIVRLRPRAAPLVLPTIVIRRVDLDDFVKRRMVALALEGFGRPARQYAALAQICRQYRQPIDLGVERSAHSSMRRFLVGKVVESQGAWRLAESPVWPALDVFRYFRFPLLALTKSDMLSHARARGYAAILELTWSCWFPVDGKPCGQCSMCSDRIV